MLISTESGGEGRNLQFAHLLMNYDLPWNPMKVEQRIGRLDRIGQKRTVFIYNLACRGTVEERVLGVLDRRIQLFTESVGSLDPILGELENELESIVMAHHDRFDDEFDSLAGDVERRAREARENERVLADFLLDRASLRRDEANRLLGEDPLATSRDLERYCEDSAEPRRRNPDAARRRRSGHHVVAEAQQPAPGRANQVHGVFDPGEALAHEDLEFFAFGNESIDQIVEYPIQNDPVSVSTRAVDYVTGGPYLEAVYEVRADASPPIGRVIRHLVDQDGTVRSEEIRTVPETWSGRPTSRFPNGPRAAVAASRRSFQDEQAQIREEVRKLHDQRVVEEEARARESSRTVAPA